MPITLLEIITSAQTETYTVEINGRQFCGIPAPALALIWLMHQSGGDGKTAEKFLEQLPKGISLTISGIGAAEMSITFGPQDNTPSTLSPQNITS